MESALKLLPLALSAVLASVLAAAAAHAQAAQDDASVLKQGESLVARDCARCHAVGRTDASKHPQAPPFRTLSKRYPIESLEEALGEGIISGHPDMPEFQFDSEDVGAIIAYLKSIQERK
jgi:mono/diheme cytochrome c family protein